MIAALGLAVGDYNVSAHTWSNINSLGVYLTLPPPLTTHILSGRAPIELAWVGGALRWQAS